MSNEIPSNVLIEYHKRFAKGEQYIAINDLNEIVPIDKEYYWQSREVFNFINGYVDKYYHHLTEEQLYGEHGLVALLAPFQRAYNAIKNKELEYINRVSLGVVVVEDGAVDIDELQEDGLSPGKILVYRQGGEAPHISDFILNTSDYLDSANDILAKMDRVAGDFYLTHMDEHKEP